MRAALAEPKHAGTVPLETVLQKHGLDHLLARPAPGPVVRVALDELESV
jgi:hypothetical protein